MHRRPQHGPDAGPERLRRDGSDHHQRPRRSWKDYQTAEGLCRHRVVLVVYGANLLGLHGDEILATRMAYEHGLGEIDLASLRVHEVAL